MLARNSNNSHNSNNIIIIINYSECLYKLQLVSITSSKISDDSHILEMGTLGYSLATTSTLVCSSWDLNPESSESQILCFYHCTIIQPSKLSLIPEVS